MLTVLYFARLRDQLGTREETLALPEGVTTLGELRAWLGQRGPAWQTALTSPGIFMAINQQVVTADAALCGHEEVAFFPPVTGG
jgi:molybdopterin synthase sulfur carrier subunit